MTQVVEKSLPNGSVSCSRVGNANIRDVLIKLNENIVTIQSELSNLQKAVVELQRR